MKKMTIILMIFFVGFAIAQENDNKVKLEKKGDLVEATYYNSNDTIEQQGFFKDNKRHGNWVSFNEKGEKIVVGHYANGKKNGKWVFRIGETLKEVDYLDNKIISVNEWSNRSSIVVYH